MIKATIITIGDEILLGQTQDTNSNFMAANLTKHGVDVVGMQTIKDEIGVIKTTISNSLNQADIVIATGGLGPTKDDKTKEALCELFEVGLVTNEEVKKKLEKRLGDRPEVLKLNEEQNLVPENATPLLNDVGTAPGLQFNIDGKMLYALPGVPSEMKHLVEEYVLPEIEQRGKREEVYHRYISVYNVPESILSKQLEVFENELTKGVSLSYLPNLNLVKLRLSFSNSSLDQVGETVKKLEYSLQKGTFYTVGEHDLGEHLGEVLKEKNIQLGIAESCTGGYLSHLITKVPGSSEYYLGSLVSYAYDVKSELLKVNKAQMLQDGAVSEDTVNQMASEVRHLLKSDCSIAISGIAGPGGATKDKPVGTVWIASNVHGEVKTKCYHFKGDREQVIIRSARNAMIQLLSHIQSIQ